MNSGLFGFPERVTPRIVRAGLSTSYTATNGTWTVISGWSASKNLMRPADDLSILDPTGSFMRPPAGIVLINVHVEPKNINANSFYIGLVRCGMNETPVGATGRIAGSVFRQASAYAQTMELTYLDRCTGNDQYYIFGYRYDGSASIDVSTSFNYWSMLMFPE